MRDLLKEINGADGDEDLVPLPFVSTVAPAPVAIDDEIAADIGDTIMEIPPSPLAAEPEPTPDPIRDDDPELEPSQNAIEDDEIADGLMRAGLHTQWFHMLTSGHLKLKA